MTVQAVALIRDVEAAGGHLAADGDQLRVSPYQMP
jgi:hypothetical protein